jgi:hypothetical protein
MLVEGGDIYIGLGATHTYGVLLVEGGVDWSGGTYHPFVEQLGVIGGITMSGRSDVWKSTDLFTISTRRGIDPHRRGRDRPERYP